MRVIAITGSDAKYFELARGTIQSIRDKPEGQSVALGFLDLGCTAEQREWLDRHVDQICSPDWEFDFPGRPSAPGYLRGLLCRPFFRRYFPGFDVYVWIDADAWVNQWSGVELLIQGAAKKGLAVALEMDRGYQVHYGGGRSLSEFMFREYSAMYGDEVARKLHTYPVINAGVFAMHRDAPHWEPWGSQLEKGLQNHVGLMSDQVALNAIVYAGGLRDHTALVPAWCNWTCHHGLPLWDTVQQTLVEPCLPHHPIGIVHLIHVNVGRDQARLRTTDGVWIKNDLRYHTEVASDRAEEVVPQSSDSKATVIFPEGDYVAPQLERVNLDFAFPHMVIGNPRDCTWHYLRREIPHNWYVDRRWPSVGFVSRDEAHLLYHNARQFCGQRALEIGCWMGWSACHLALAGVELDIVDPALNEPQIRQSVTQALNSVLNSRGLRSQLTLHPGASPETVKSIAARNHRWSLFFIDGDHEAPAPLRDAMVCEECAEPNAMVLFHDLASPAVAEGLHYFRQRGWNTLVYHTMQIMAVAWRGSVQPVAHKPDSRIGGTVPSHLNGYKISGSSG